MRVVGLDGREYALASQSQTRRRKPSSHHLRARELLKMLYPGERIPEEVSLPGCKTSLFLDFFLPQHNLAIEVQGPQHFRFTAFFHRDRLAYLEARTRDQEKRRFCEVNGIILVEFPHDRSEQQWRETLLRSLEAGSIPGRTRPLRGGPESPPFEDGAGDGSNKTA